MATVGEAGMAILTQFLFRLAFGMALAMGITSPRLVTSGYFRVHLYVILGLGVLGSAVAWSQPERFALWPALTMAVLSYVGSVVWLYEKPAAGRVLLFLVAGMALVGSWIATDIPAGAAPLIVALSYLDPASGGLVLGGTMAAMLLGHWYLNTPTMQLEPLKRLILLMAVAIALRAVISGTGAVVLVNELGWPSAGRMAFLSLRWLSGIVGAMATAIMAWETLKVPNTQSATGILYVGVITTFLGELTSQLLTVELGIPL
jgi:hypothetical protein